MKSDHLDGKGYCTTTMSDCKCYRDRYIPFIRQELPAEDSAKVAAHLACCPDCAEEVAVLRAVYSTLPELPVYSSPDVAQMAYAAIDAAKPSPRFRWLPAMAVASLILIMGIVYLFTPQHTPVKQTVATRTGVQPTVTHTTPVLPKSHERTVLPRLTSPVPTGKHVARIHHHKPQVRTVRHAPAPPVAIHETETASLQPNTGQVSRYATLLAQYLLQDHPTATSGREVRCAVLPMTTTDERETASADSLTVQLVHELTRRLPEAKLTRLVAAQEPTLSTGSITADNPELARLAAEAKSDYLVLGRFAKRDGKPLLELYLVNTATRTLVFDGRHPVCISPDELAAASDARRG